MPREGGGKGHFKNSWYAHHAEAKQGNDIQATVGSSEKNTQNNDTVSVLTQNPRAGYQRGALAQVVHWHGSEIDEVPVALNPSNSDLSREQA